MVGRQNWRASRFETRAAIDQAQPVGPYPNRELALAAVPDPYLLASKPVRVTVALDTLDRLLRQRRIGPGAHAAGRAYQRLLEISLGSTPLGGGGVQGLSAGDDLAVRAITNAARVNHELTLIRRIIGQRSEHLLRAVLIDGRSLGDLAGASKHRAHALAQRLVESLEDLAERWRAVALD